MSARSCAIQSFALIPPSIRSDCHAAPSAAKASIRSRHWWASDSIAARTIWSRVVPSVSPRSEEHTSELQSLMRISYAVFCLKKKNTKQHTTRECTTNTHRTEYITPSENTHITYN